MFQRKGSFKSKNSSRGLEIEITVDDLKGYTKPWTIKMNQTIKLDTDLLDYICLENEKDVQHLVAQ
jgi:hypothetical protein